MLALAWLGLTHRAHRDDWLRGEGVVAHGERERDYRHTRHTGTRVREDCGGCAGAGVSGGLCARLACLRASLASRSAATSYSPGKRELSAARMGAG